MTSSLMLSACNSGEGSAETGFIGSFCSEQKVEWTDNLGTQSCSAVASSATNNQELVLFAEGENGTGQATYLCKDTAWYFQEGSCGSNAVTVDVNIDKGSQFIDYFSNAYGEVGKSWKGSESIEGFFFYSTVNENQVADAPAGGGADIFPNLRVNMTTWQRGLNFVYDPDLLQGVGEESAELQDIIVDFETLVDSSSTVLSRPAKSTIELPTPRPVLHFEDGVLTHMTNMKADIEFAWDGMEEQCQYPPFDAICDELGLTDKLAYSGTLEITSLVNLF